MNASLVLSVAAVSAPPDDAPAPWLRLVEELVAEPSAMDARLETRDAAVATLPRLLALSVGVLVGWSALQVGLASAVDLAPDANPLRGVGILVAAYAGGIPGATAAALPALAVGALLAGVDAPAWRVSALFARSLAEAMVALAGVTPIYALAVLGLRVLPEALTEFAAAALHVRAFRLDELAMLVGYALPFAAGLAGRRALCRSFARVTGGVGARRAQRLVEGCTALLLALSFLGTAGFALAMS